MKNRYVMMSVSHAHHCIGGGCMRPHSLYHTRHHMHTSLSLSLSLSIRSILLFFTMYWCPGGEGKVCVCGGGVLLVSLLLASRL